MTQHTKTITELVQELEGKVHHRIHELYKMSKGELEDLSEKVRVSKYNLKHVLRDKKEDLEDLKKKAFKLEREIAYIQAIINGGAESEK